MTKINPTQICPATISPEKVSGDMSRLRVLMVDDSSMMRKIVERSLRQAGLDLQVLEAGNGARALATLQENTVDLILCDINMPVMDGLEFVNKLGDVENANGVPGGDDYHRGQRARVLDALSAGACGYIRKPFIPDQVNEHVLPLLEAQMLDPKTLEPKP